MVFTIKIKHGVTIMQLKEARFIRENTTVNFGYVVFNLVDKFDPR